MALATEKPLLARSDYIIQAPQHRVWDLLASSVIQGMPVEQMDIVSDTTIVAVLRVKVGFIEVPVDLKVEVADITPMQSLSTLVNASKRGIKSTLRVSFALAAVTEDETSVACTAVEEASSPVMRLMRWQQRRFAGEIFASIKDRLERFC